MVEVLVTSSVMILGILCLRKLTMGNISMRLRYALWLLVAVRLLIPVSVGTSPVSVMNLLPGSLRESDQTGARISDFENEQTANGVETVFPLQRSAQEAEEHNQNVTTVINETQKIPGGFLTAGVKGESADREGVSPVYVIWIVWVLGFLAVGGYMLFMRARFVWYLHKNREKIAGEEIPVIIGEKLAGCEDVFINRLSPLAVQVLCNESGDGGFRFGQPKVDEKYQIHNLVQERKLEEIKNVGR